MKHLSPCKRCGELLKEIPAKGGYVNGGGATPHRSQRAAAARDAGLSTDQRKTALRVASVPKGQYDASRWDVSLSGRCPYCRPTLAEAGTDKEEI
jgi:hypothetical protein